MSRHAHLFPWSIAAALVLALPALAGCVSNAPAGSGSARIDVESTATECRVSAGTAKAGTITFSVRNSGDQATEFYLLGKDGVQVVGEVEDIGPGLTRDLAVKAVPGTYMTACKPGMVGDGIRAPFTVTE